MHNIHLTAVSLTILSSVYAQDFVSKSANSAAVQSALSSISSLEALLVPPSSIASELTGVPASVTSALNDPSQISALQSQFISSLPSWYTALPSEAQAYIVSVGAAAQTIQPQILSLEQVAGVNIAPSTAASGSSTQPGGIMSTASVTGSLTTAAASGSETTSSSQPGGPLSSFSRPTSETGTTGPEQSSSVSATGTAASSSSSSAGAAKATSGPSGAVAVGLMGAIGLFGVAVAL